MLATALHGRRLPHRAAVAAGAAAAAVASAASAGGAACRRRFLTAAAGGGLSASSSLTYPFRAPPVAKSPSGQFSLTIRRRRGDDHRHHQDQQRSFHSLLLASSNTNYALDRDRDDRHSSGGNNHRRRPSPAAPDICLPQHRLQQVRWKRRDGNKAFSKTRPPTKKQRKAYNRKLRDLQQKQGRHGAPGSKAGERREYLRAEEEDLLRSLDGDGGGGHDDDASMLEDYGIDDALLDDLMGNTKELTWQPTPRPVYLGHRHEMYDAKLRNEIEGCAARRAAVAEAMIESGQGGEGDDASSSRSSLSAVADRLPSDRSIALALRAFRDKNGTRQRPVGIVAALEYLLKDAGVPGVAAFGELTYTALLTCSRTPVEARRIFQMMRREGHPISSYSWSILVDVHAKVGDYSGAADVMEEMVSQGGCPPTLAAYTSFLAACYKVCNDGRVSHGIRAKAGKLAFEKWQEMRVVGVNPDAMAYGAMLRVFAAQGHPERAINVLEEMQQMEVKPTTLCFSSALRAVAKSHATAIRYERGSSKKNRRREFLTQHHGKMARSIVIMAENAEVEQDAGFVSALILCAGAAGDAATAKAVYVASQIRELNQFRTIGPDSHLARLSGGSSPSEASSLEETISLPADGNPAAGALQEAPPARTRRHYPSFEEREYGKDSRVLSAILHACAQAVNQNSIGTMWAGRENLGYLCDNSLRLLTARRVPRYTDNSIPGLTRTANLTWDGEHKDEDYRDGKRRQRNFSGVEVSEDGASTLDELDETFSRMFLDDDGRLREEFRKTTPEDVWRMKYGDDHDESSSDEHPLLATGEANKDTEEGEAEEEEELFFDYDSMRWKTRPKNTSIETGGVEKVVSAVDLSDNDESAGEQHSQGTESLVDDNEELYFDNDTMRWKTRLRSAPAEEVTLTDFESKMLQTRSADKDDEHTTPSDEFDPAEFSAFYSELQAEIAESGDDVESVNEEEARELFLLMKAEYEEVMSADFDDLKSLMAEQAEDDTVYDLLEKAEKAIDGAASAQEDSVDAGSLGGDLSTNGVESNQREGDGSDLNTFLEQAAQSLSTMTVPLENPAEMSAEKSADAISSKAPALRDENFPQMLDMADLDEVAYDDVDEQLEELKQLLPAFSETRLRKIISTFRKSLADPSLLDLIPVVRERMPDYLTATWLKKMSLLTARYVVLKAEEEGLVDQHVMNSVLELETLSGSVDRALSFYETAFKENNLAPNDYSNRLVLQMLLRSNRLSRALAFREELNGSGRILDLPSYGSLVDYCSRHGQIGSSMMLLKECLSVHGSPPGEAYLSRLRVLCRKTGLDNELEMLAGKDPVQWLRHGEAHLKREMSKRGRRDVLFARNRLVQL